MTATITTTVPSSTPTTQPEQSTSRPSLVRAGAVAGVVAAVATTVIAAVAHGAGVPLETAPGEQIPVLGFAQLTLFFTAIGVVIAAVLRRRAHRPQSTFVKVTVVLTARRWCPISCSPPMSRRRPPSSPPTSSPQRSSSRRCRPASRSTATDAPPLTSARRRSRKRLSASFFANRIASWHETAASGNLPRRRCTSACDAGRNG